MIIMKGTLEQATGYLPTIILVLIVLAAIIFIVYYFRNELLTPLCRHFCLSLSEIKYIGKYLGGYFCNLCG